MIVLGLTGGIAMGKSTVAKQFAKLGAATHNADIEVHRLLGKGGKAVAAVSRLFPEAFLGGAIDRAKLGQIVFHDPAALRRLEAVLHPLVREAEENFVAKARRHGKKIAVLDIPLLFETGADQRVDLTATVTCPLFLQKQRALQRPNMTEEKFRRILAQQMPDREKCARADFIIPTGMGKARSFSVVKRIMAGLV